MHHGTPARTSSPSVRTELARTFGGLARARDLYERCLELDSRFAPAWAHLGRCHRVIGKFVDGTPGASRAPSKRSAVLLSSTRACPWRTSSTPTWRETSVRR